MKKIIRKLKENKGADTTIETMGSIWIYILIFLLVLGFFSIMYKEYQLHTFVNELIRTAEVYGEVGTKTNEREKELIENLGINPTVRWGKTGTYQLNETIEVMLELPLKIDIGFWQGGITLTKKAIGTSEVYRK